MFSRSINTFLNWSSYLKKLPDMITNPKRLKITGIYDIVIWVPFFLCFHISYGIKTNARILMVLLPPQLHLLVYSNKKKFKQNHRYI